MRMPGKPTKARLEKSRKIGCMFPPRFTGSELIDRKQGRIAISRHLELILFQELPEEHIKEIIK